MVTATSSQLAVPHQVGAEPIDDQFVAEFLRVWQAAWNSHDPDRVVDPFFFALWHLRSLRSRQLGFVCERFGVKLLDAHSAAADASTRSTTLSPLRRAALRGW